MLLPLLEVSVEADSFRTATYIDVLSTNLTVRVSPLYCSVQEVLLWNCLVVRCSLENVLLPTIKK